MKRDRIHNLCVLGALLLIAIAVLRVARAIEFHAEVMAKVLLA